MTYGQKLEVFTVYVNPSQPTPGSVEVFVRRNDERAYVGRRDLARITLHPDEGEGWKGATVHLMRPTGWSFLIELEADGGYELPVESTVEELGVLVVRSIEGLFG